MTTPTTSAKVLHIAALASLLVAACSTSALGADFSGKLKGVTITDAEQVNTPPVAKLSYSESGNTFIFDASASLDQDGSIVKTKWNINNSYVSEGPTATYENLSGKAFPVTLTIIDNSGAISIIQQQVTSAVAGTIYWSMESLPNPTIISDAGDLLITKAQNDASLVPGVKGNGIQQVGMNTAYYLPMDSIPNSKATIEVYLRHDFPPVTTDPTYRTIFKSTKTNTANTISIFTYKNAFYFNLYDSNGVMHRALKTSDNWATKTWYKYQFSWDNETGLMQIMRDGVTIASSSTMKGSQFDWTNQNLYMGDAYQFGSFDELKISQ